MPYQLSHQFLTNHFHQPSLPRGSPLLFQLARLAKRIDAAIDRLCQSRRSFSRGGDRPHNRGDPSFSMAAQRLHGTYFPFHPIGALTIAFVHHKNIGDFKNPRLDALHIIAKSGHQHHDGDIRQPHNIHFILTHADRFNQQARFAARLHHGSNIRRRRCQSSKKSPRGHAANVKPRIGVMALHANSIAQDRAARERTGRVHRHNADGLLFGAVMRRQPIHQRALPRTRSTGQSNPQRIARMWKACRQNRSRSRRVIFYQRDRPSQSAHIPAPQAGDKMFDGFPSAGRRGGYSCHTRLRSYRVPSALGIPNSTCLFATNRRFQESVNYSDEELSCDGSSFFQKVFPLDSALKVPQSVFPAASHVPLKTL